MKKTLPISISIRLISLILVLLINTVSFPSFSDHLKTQKYHTANTKLLKKVKSRLVKNKTDPRKKIFYIGAGLWGNERWSTNDAVQIGNALENFYPKRNVIKIILSNDEKKKLPDIYPSTFYLPTVAKLVAPFYKKNDLIIIGLYSHGAKGIIGARHGGKAHKPNALRADYIKKHILNRLGVDKSKVVLILSACYSGSLTKPLQHRNVVIATSADRDKVSFGCGNNSTNSFYASALISELTRRKSSKTYSIVNALEVARRTVQAMEVQKGYPRSNPQLAVGRNF